MSDHLTFLQLRRYFIRGLMTERLSIESIVQRVRDEFGSKAALFGHVALRMNALDCPDFEKTKYAGVYVFVHDIYGCVKVGKSQSNASKRALEHCRDNTSSKDGAIRMADLRNCDKTQLLIFTLQKTDSMHWVLALEHFLENTLKPRICSIRNG